MNNSLWLLVILVLFDCNVALKCSQYRVRREIRDITHDEFMIFANALKVYNSKSNGSSKLDDWVKLHADHAANAHGIPVFLPWHRYYMWVLEEELIKIDSRVVIPYWDWSLDSQAPETSLVFRSDYLGGNGNSTNQCVTNGVFSDWEVSFPSQGCLKRSFDGGNRISALASSDNVEMVITTAANFDSFRQSVEGALHGPPHNNIGGHMATMYSSNDPIFWLHHGYVDYMWKNFQNRGPQFSSQYTQGGDISEIMIPFNLPVSTAMDTSSLCYDYAAPGTVEIRRQVIANNGAPPATTTNAVHSATPLITVVATTPLITVVTTTPLTTVVTTTPLTTVVATTPLITVVATAPLTTLVPTTASATQPTIASTTSTTIVATQTSTEPTRTTTSGISQSVLGVVATPSTIVLTGEDILKKKQNHSANLPFTEIGKLVQKIKKIIEWNEIELDYGECEKPLVFRKIELFFSSVDSHLDLVEDSLKYRSKSPDPLDRSDSTRMRIPKPVPESWLQMNHIDVDVVRAVENIFAEAIDFFNSGNQISVSANKVVEMARQFYGEKKGATTTNS